MADYEYMTDLLKQWGLEGYIDLFISDKVDAGCLRIIDDGDIKQLIPLAGDRARFKSNLALWKAELNVDVSKTLTFEETSQPVETANIGKNTKQSISNSNEDTEEDNSVLKLLNSSIDGKAILKSGQNNQGLLDQTLRSRLARLIATKELTDNPSGVVPGCKLMKCAHEIAQIFPKESPTIYYIPYVSATSQQIKINASGKLYDAVVNRRKDLRKRGAIAGSSRSSRSSSSETSSAAEVTSLTFLPVHSEGEPEVEEKLHWLRNSVDPWHLVESNWEATTNVRLATLQSKSGTVEEYLNLYPALKLPEGYRLAPRSLPGLQAIAYLKADEESEVTGELLFTQIVPNGPVTIEGNITGLEAGLHGLHVHQSGAIHDNCKDIGPHFIAYYGRHGGPRDHIRHVGDLGNVKAEEGTLTVKIVDHLVSLAGPRSIVGRSVAVTKGEDDYGRAGTEDSALTGSSGPAVACGIIAYMN